MPDSSPRHRARSHPVDIDYDAAVSSYRAACCRWIVLALCYPGAGGHAQAPPPPDPELSTLAAKRFPQPVRVGDLIGRRILASRESRPVLGSVVAVIREREPADTLEIVIQRGAVLGFGGRLIAVPVATLGLLGNELELLDLTPEQLDDLPTFTADTAIVIAADQEIRVGLAHPAH